MKKTCKRQALNFKTLICKHGGKSHFPKDSHICFCSQHVSMGFLGDSVVKNLPSTPETWVQSLGLEDPLEKKWQPAPLFLPGESHGERSLVGYSPWGRIQSATTEQLADKRQMARILCFERHQKKSLPWANFYVTAEYYIHLKYGWAQVRKEMLMLSYISFVTPWTVAHQAPLSMGFSRQE